MEPITLKMAMVDGRQPIFIAISPFVEMEPNAVVIIVNRDRPAPRTSNSELR